MRHGINRPALEYGSGFPTLLFKEVKRFYKVAFQTIAAPVLTAVLYLMIFGHVLEGKEIYGRLSYTAFLIPGLVMMSVLQNAFANTSSSLIQSKVTGNLVFVLLAPLSHFEFYAAYILAAVFRGIVVGLGVLLITIWFATPSLEYPLWILVFAFLGAAILGSLGLIAGIWADKYDQLAAFQNFIIMPATMLSGVSIPFILCRRRGKWSHISTLLYMIDGFRYGFFGVSDNSPWASLAIVFCFLWWCR